MIDVFRCRYRGFASRRGGASLYYLAESQCAGRGDIVCQRGVRHSYHIVIIVKCVTIFNHEQICDVNFVVSNDEM